MDVVINALEQGLLFALVAMGVYITYKILDFPDLSVDGTFPLGASISAALLINGVNPWISILIATIGGAIAGSITGFLHVKLKISNLMSGILVMMGLYSVNLRIMGKSNIPLFNTNYIFKSTAVNSIFIILAIVVVVKIILDLFLKTKAGFLLTAVGDNEQVVSSLGVNKNLVKVLGLAISNGLVALAGALTAQHQGFADVTMGTGIVVMGLAAVIIGVSIFGKISFIKATTLSIFGAIIYKLVIAIALWMKLNPNDLKILTAVLVSIDINKGDFITIIGSNGAGKSTLLNLISGNINIDSGLIVLDGKDVSYKEEFKRAKYIGRVYQNPSFGVSPNMTILENLALADNKGKKYGLSFGINKKRIEYYKELLTKLDLGLENKLYNKVTLLSGGQRQALTLMMAVMSEPKLLLLDEHTAALDPKTSAKIMEITKNVVKEKGITTLMVTHNMKHALECGNRLLMMHAGKVIVDVSGKEKKNLTTEKLMEMFGKANAIEELSDRSLLTSLA